MPIPDHLKQYCNNPELEIFSCDFYMHKNCTSTCSFSRRLAQGISHSARTGLERFTEKYGEDWRLIAFGEQSPIINPVPNEIDGEYKG